MSEEAEVIETEQTTAVEDAAPEPSAPETSGDDLSAIIDELMDSADEPKQTEEPVKAEGEAQTEEPQEPVASSVPVPADWPAKYREAFAKMSPEGQAAWMAHTDDFRAALQAQQEDVAFGRAIRSSVSDQHREQLQAAGFKNEAEGLRALLGLNDFATRDPVGYLNYVMNQTGVTPEMLMNSGAAAQPSYDPRIENLTSQVKDLSGKLQEREKAEAEAYQGQLSSIISDFANAKSDDGTTKYPYFADVRTLMGSLMQQGIYDDLDGAYQAAVRAHPTIGPKVAEEQKAAAAEAERKAKAAEKAKKAKLANASAQPAGVSVSMDLDKIIDEQLEAFY